MQMNDKVQIKSRRICPFYSNPSLSTTYHQNILVSYGSHDHDLYRNVSFVLFSFVFTEHCKLTPTYQPKTQVLKGVIRIIKSHNW